MGIYACVIWCSTNFTKVFEYVSLNDGSVLCADCGGRHHRHREEGVSPHVGIFCLGASVRRDGRRGGGDRRWTESEVQHFRADHFSLAVEIDVRSTSLLPPSQRKMRTIKDELPTPRPGRPSNKSKDKGQVAAPLPLHVVCKHVNVRYEAQLRL